MARQLWELRPSQRPVDPSRLRRVEGAARGAAPEHDRVAIVHGVPPALTRVDRVTALGRTHGYRWIAGSEVGGENRSSRGGLRVQPPEDPALAAHALPVDDTAREQGVALEQDVERRSNLADGRERQPVGRKLRVP